jgi:MtN3 and saliva related transmembrane protein
MNNFEYIGFIAGFCTTIAFIPQAIKIIKTKSTKDISLPMYIIYSIGLIMWLTYGYLNNSYSLIAANIITLVLSTFILTIKLKEK